MNNKNASIGCIFYLLCYILSVYRPTATIETGALELPTTRREAFMSACVCSLANDGICMGICSLGISHSGYSLKASGDKTYLVHHALKHPLVIIASSDVEMIDKVNLFLNKSVN